MKKRFSSYFSPTFLAFLLIATLLWYANKLGDNYTTEAVIPVQIQNDFSARMWIEEPLVQVNCRIEGLGTALVGYKMRLGNRLTIPMSQLDLIPVEGQRLTFRVDKSSLRAALSATIKDLRIAQVLDSAIYIHVSPVESRRMAVENRIEVIPARQYMQVGKVRFTPDSVDVRGPKVILDSIRGIWTKNKTYEGVTQPVHGSIDLLPPQGIMVSHQEVDYKAEVWPYTQSTLDIPVEVQHVPDTLLAMTVPAQVRVTVNVPLRDYDRLKEAPLVARIDYRQVTRERGGRYAVGIDSLPGGAEVVKIEPPFVEPFFNQK